MTITIPTWVLWALGVPLGTAAIFFAVIGIAVAWSMKDFRLY